MQSIPDQSEEQLDECMLAVAVEETIAEHGGDARAAVRALLINVVFLEAARDRALDLVSRGYTRADLRESVD